MVHYKVSPKVDISNLFESLETGIREIMGYEQSRELSLCMAHLEMAAHFAKAAVDKVEGSGV